MPMAQSDGFTLWKVQKDLHWRAEDGAVVDINSTFRKCEMIDAVAETQSGNAAALESGAKR